MKKINRDIVKDFNKFISLVKDRKHTSERTITLNSQKPNRKDINYNESDLKHVILTDKIRLLIEVKRANYTSFKFKLRCETFTQEPYFRFDSDGAAHKNDNPAIPLKEQMVTTPHFNSFDNEGRSIAYKTEKLKNVSEAKALEDISLCFAHFSHESNIRYPEDEITEIIPTPSTELKLDTNNDDILSNINFSK
ncbi:MAG: hypothetical protein WAT19_09625 [Ferruginibacter sp.]